METEGIRKEQNEILNFKDNELEKKLNKEKKL